MKRKAASAARVGKINLRVRFNRVMSRMRHIFGRALLQLSVALSDTLGRRESVVLSSSNPSTCPPFDFIV